MRNIQYHIDLLLGTSLSYLSHYYINPIESEILREKVKLL